MAATEQSINLLSLRLELLDASLIAFARSTFSFLDSLELDRSPNFANCIQDVIVDFRHHMKHAKLVLCRRPDFGNRFLILELAIEKGTGLERTRRNLRQTPCCSYLAQELN